MKVKLWTNLENLLQVIELLVQIIDRQVVCLHGRRLAGGLNLPTSGTEFMDRSTFSREEEEESMALRKNSLILNKC